MTTIELDRSTDSDNTPYSGWPNRKTWNVALWINNDRELYDLAKNSTESYLALALRFPYATPDGVSYFDAAIDEVAINAMLDELRND